MSFSIHIEFDLTSQEDIELLKEIGSIAGSALCGGMNDNDKYQTAVKELMQRSFRYDKLTAELAGLDDKEIL